MKNSDLSSARKNNLSTKKNFKVTDARPAGQPNQNSALSAARDHNKGAKEHFTSGGQKSANLTEKCHG